MFPKLGKKKSDFQEDEEISLIEEEESGPEEELNRREDQVDQENHNKACSERFASTKDVLFTTKISPDVLNNNNYESLIFDRLPMLSRSRTVIKTLVKFFINLILKLWKGASSFVIAIFFVSWFYGGVYPYIVCFIALLGLGYQISDTLIYQPESPLESRVLVPSPTQYGLPFEAITIYTKDRVKLHAYLIKQQTNSRHVPTIIYLHGNAGNIGHRLDNVKLFYNKVKCNTLLLEYRGYGQSEGSPSESGFYLDSQAAFEFVDGRADLDSSKIILFGRSLGGAVAIDLAARCDYRDRIAAVIVENTFTSIPELAKVLFPIRVVGWIPKFCYKNKYDSLKKISTIVCPTLFICGKKDELIPPKMTLDLYNKCSTEAKALQQYPTGGHNDTWLCKDYSNHLATFIQEVSNNTIGRNFKSYESYSAGDNIV